MLQYQKIKKIDPVDLVVQMPYGIRPDPDFADKAEGKEMKLYESYAFEYTVSNKHALITTVKFDMNLRDSEEFFDEALATTYILRDNKLIVDRKDVKFVQKLENESFKTDKRRKLMLVIFHLILKIGVEPVSKVLGKQVNKKERLTIFERKGDSFVYRKLREDSILHTRSFPQRNTITRHRDHAVAGHWRHYKSGKKVWVKSHRRGDPSLGTVTQVIQF